METFNENDFMKFKRACNKELVKSWKKRNPEKARQHQRDWRKRNPEKVKQYQENYWRKKYAKHLEEQKTETIEQKAIRLHREGNTQRQIAAELGISLGSVNKYLNK
ncbi:MAG TPA: hypothetical protein DCM62_10160 [Bacteroidales bacterium]|nr:hypothetical protein [Bacteroidales bacterium]